jgi:hypothetical protein
VTSDISYRPNVKQHQQFLAKRQCDGATDVDGFSPPFSRLLPDHPYTGDKRSEPYPSPRDQSWPGESGQRDEWIFCLNAADIAADQERA